MVDVITVTLPSPPSVVTVTLPAPTQTVTVAIPGIQGPMGPAGTSSDDRTIEYKQTTPLSTWVVVIPPSFTRRPCVSIYDPAGIQIETDVQVSATTVTITYPSPATGSVVLN